MWLYLGIPSGPPGAENQHEHQPAHPRGLLRRRRTHHARGDASSTTGKKCLGILLLQNTVFPQTIILYKVIA